MNKIKAQICAKIDEEVHERNMPDGYARIVKGCMEYEEVREKQDIRELKGLYELVNNSFDGAEKEVNQSGVELYF